MYSTALSPRQFPTLEQISMDFSGAQYSASAYQTKEFLPDTGIEIAFAGRSNSGKSSAINALAGRKKLAFVSNTPGRTQTINFFDVARARRWVDLPGYGYAKVSHAAKDHWKELIGTYLSERKSLNGLIIIVDSRRGLTPLDEQLIEWFSPSGKPMHILLTKCDKLNRRDQKAVLDRSTELLANRWPSCTLQLFSSLTRVGISQVRGVLARWLT